MQNAKKSKEKKRDLQFAGNCTGQLKPSEQKETKESGKKKEIMTRSMSFH